MVAVGVGKNYLTAQQRFQTIRFFAPGISRRLTTYLYIKWFNISVITRLGEAN